MNKPLFGLVIVASMLVLAGCQNAPETAEAPEPVRPVLTKTMALEVPQASRFAGLIAPQFETALSFRIFGRVIERTVEVGDYVEADQQIAQLDATALQLAVRSAMANLSSAEAQLTNLVAIEQRQRSLLERNLVSAADFESAEQARRSGESSVAQAQAQVTKAQEQLGYATLRADTAGLVTAVDMELGQTVTAGQTVATVVRPESREAIVSVLETVAANLSPGDRFMVARQVDPATAIGGVIREIAPQADANTRTVEVSIDLENPPDSFKLGSTITATLAETDAERLVVPSTAVVEDDDGAHVWVIDVASQTVAQRDITAEPLDAANMVVSEGLAAGDIVVVAGANSLAEGQSIRLSQGVAP